jgi:flagellar P-ring protein precursor FlgI
MIRTLAIVLFGLFAAVLPAQAGAGDVRLKDLGRFLGWRDNALIGYGIVTGLSGSGDSPRSVATRQALSNVLGRLGSNIPADQLQSRNTAIVMVTATLPPSANVGDRIDVTVTSIGDARSLAGGVLLMTPMIGPDRNTYALAQGALTVGGYDFRDNLNLRQKNYPTTGIVAGGASVETAVAAPVLGPDGQLSFILKDPDYTTAQRIADALNAQIAPGIASVPSPDTVRISAASGDLSRLIARIENVEVAPDSLARVVINARSGTVVAGGDVRVASVVVAQGDIKVSVTSDSHASQPYFVAGDASGVSSLVVTNTKLDVEDNRNAVVRFPNTTVADLVLGLNRAKVSTADIIAILQAIKAAGALHAEIVVQ